MGGMTLVVGATGPIGLGGELCRLLRAEGRPVRALVRRASDARRVGTLRHMGVELVEGDLKDPESLERACRGARAVISTASMMVSRQADDTVERVDGRGHIDLVDAARASGVESFVYTSFSGHIDREFPFRNAKRGVERHLEASGLPYTILRPTFYMEVWLSPIGGFDFAEARASIYGDGRNKISWLSFYDVARFAMMCVDSPMTRGATYELGGPEALSPLEVVRIFEGLSGRTFALTFISEQALSEQQTASNNSWERSLLGLQQGYADGAAVDMRELIHQFPLTLTSVREYASRVLGLSDRAGNA